MISSDDFEFINELDSSLDKQSVLEKHGKNSAKAFVNLIGQISRDQTVRYLLTLIDDLLTLNRENIYLFHQFGVTIGQSAWTPFLNLLSRPDQYISCQASRITARDPRTARFLNFAGPALILGPNPSIRDQSVFVRGSLITAKLASWGKLRFNQDEKLVFVNYLIKKFTEDKSEWLIASTSSLLIILRVVENRKISIEMGIDKMLVNLLGRSGKSFQLQYQVSLITDSTGTEKQFRNEKPFRVSSRSKLEIELKTRSEFRSMLEPCRPLRSSRQHARCTNKSRTKSPDREPKLGPVRVFSPVRPCTLIIRIF